MDEEEPPTKKLRSAYAELKVVVGSDCTDGETLVEYYHSVVMAKHSTFIDTWLEAPNTSQEATMEINFPDVSPDTWKKMITLIEDPVASRDCSVRDALECLPCYHKYDFSKGVKLCEHILNAYMLKTLRHPKDYLEDIDTFVDVAVMADELHCASIKPLAIKVLARRLGTPRLNISFTETHIKKLVPLMHNNMKGLRLPVAVRFTKDEILSPLFPRMLLKAFSATFSECLINTELAYVELSGTSCRADGPFTTPYLHSRDWDSDRTVRWGGVQLKIGMDMENGPWEIFGETLPQTIPAQGDEDSYEDYESVERKTLWNCPGSENFPLPPKTGWKAVSKLARGTPQVNYVFDADE